MYNEQYVKFTKILSKNAFLISKNSPNYSHDALKDVKVLSGDTSFEQFFLIPNSFF